MKRVLALAVLACALLVAACGGSHHHHAAAVSSSTTTTSTTISSTSTSSLGYPCNPANWAMQCNGAAAEQAPPPNLGVSPTDVFGIDTYTGGNVASGAFDCSYVYLAGKGWTGAALNAWHAAGKPTCAVFEQGAAQAEDGFGQGQADAHYSLDWANSVGMPSYAPIFFAVDTDAAASSVSSYFAGVHSVLGSRTGAYGSYFVIAGLEADHLITPNTAWQTLAWSAGRVGNACLYQRAIPEMGGTFVNGAWVDLDTARCANWGQWPLAKPPKPVDPHHYGWLPNTRHKFRVQAGSTEPCVFEPTASDCIQVKARERSAVQNWDKHKCSSTALGNGTTVKSRRCREYRQHMQLLDGRIQHIARHTPNLKHRVKHPRWGAIHYRAKDGHKTTLGGANQQLVRRLSNKNHGDVTQW